MTPDRWQKIEDLFQAALDFNGDERMRFISNECGSDDDLRREVEALLSFEITDECFLESSFTSTTDAVNLLTLTSKVISGQGKSYLDRVGS